MKTTLRAMMLAASSAPPSEFRLFRRGANATSKGVFYFTEESARSVMAAFARGGVDLPVDLEHQSLDPTALALRSDACDARGWFSLDVRNGELWATNVKWAPDGLRRLANKTQRYISPAFDHTEDGVIREIVNCALCAMPATYNAPALVAASRGNRPVVFRAPKSTHDQLRQLAAVRRTTVSQLLRAALSSLDGSASPDDPASVLSAVAVALGLDPASDPTVISAALSAIISALPDDDSGGS